MDKHFAENRYGIMKCVLKKAYAMLIVNRVTGLSCRNYMLAKHALCEAMKHNAKTLGCPESDIAECVALCFGKPCNGNKCGMIERNRRLEMVCRLIAKAYKDKDVSCIREKLLQYCDDPGTECGIADCLGDIECALLNPNDPMKMPCSMYEYVRMFSKGV